MRLDEQQILDGLLHERQRVRNLAQDYFVTGFTENPRVMPRVIEAIERFGWDNAFFASSFLADLPQTDETLGWAIEELRSLSERETDRAMNLCRLIADAEIEPLLRSENEAREALERFPEPREIFEERLRLLGEEVEAVWESLWRFSEASREAQYPNEVDLPYARCLIEAIAREPEGFADRTVALLDEHDDPDGEGFNPWTEGFAVELAGRMRLEAAVPRIVRKLQEGADLLSEECVHALARIGTDAAVDAVGDAFEHAEWPFRLYASDALGRIHTPRSVERALELADREEDEEIRCFLLNAAVRQFDDRAVEPARQHLLSRELTPELSELRSDLVDTAELMGVSFPERERWQEESERDAEFRREWYAQRGLLPPQTTPKPEPPQTPAPVRRAEKIGRNDPCPCGSGKKYKKCCMRA